MTNAIDTQQLIELQRSYIRNPNKLQEVALNLYERINNGEAIPVEGSNPFTYSLEFGVTAAVTSTLSHETLIRRVFPSMAKTDEEIYLHMADADYLGRFAKPSARLWTIAMTMDDIVGNSVPLRDGSGARVIVLPKDSTFTVGTTTFTLQYPLVIKVLQNGALSTYFDISTPSPIYQPVTNMLRWLKMSTPEGVEYVAIQVPTQQVKITSQVVQTVSFTGYAKSFSFEDYFYHARAYVRDARAGKWVEIHTTHNEQIYDPSRPTICLTVLNNSLQVYIPQIYFENGLITDAVRLDIYTTRGEDREDYTQSDAITVKHVFRDLDNNGFDEYSQNVNRMTSFAIRPEGDAVGGSGPLQFSELKRRITQRSTVTAGLPITTNQLSTSLEDLGFNMITTLDQVTQRQYCAVRSVEPPTDGQTVTGLGVSMQNVEFSLDELRKASGVYDNQLRVTLPPQTLFNVVDGYTKIVPLADIIALKQLALNSPDGLTNHVNNNQYYYTPYHYVFDTSDNRFTVRPYHLTSPTILSRYMLQQNNGLGIDIRSEHYEIRPSDDGSGYSVFVTLLNNSSLKSFTADRVSLQLSYSPKGSKRRGYVMGHLVSKVDPKTNQPVDNLWLYQFDIKTDYDINDLDQLKIKDTGYFVELTQDFDILFVVKNHRPTNAGVSDIDSIVNLNYIEDFNYLDNYLGASQEVISIQFGFALNHLWRRSRTIVATGDIVRYEEDVMQRYMQDVYKTDKNGNIVVHYDYDTSELSYDKLHSKGDPVLDKDGEPVPLHRKGDPVLDAFGNTIPVVNDSKLTRLVDLFLMDGKYYFATYEPTINYVRNSLDQITTWITDTLKHQAQRTLERTELYFYPKNNIGAIDVIVGDGRTIRTNADRSLTVTYTLSKDKASNAEFTSMLRARTASLVASTLERIVRMGGGVISSNALDIAVKNLIGDEVYDVHVEGYFDDGEETILTTDVTAIPSVGKKLIVQSNLTLAVKDDVTVFFKILDRGINNTFLERKED